MKGAALGTGGLGLISLVLIGAHLLLLGAAARAESGHTPFTAMPLDRGAQWSRLGPRQADWYKLGPGEAAGASQRQTELTLIFTPDDGTRAGQVHLLVFPSDQLERWYWGNLSLLEGVGSASAVSRDGNPVTGELVWSGQTRDDTAYTVYVLNGSDVRIRYRILRGNVVDTSVGESRPVVEVPAGMYPYYPQGLSPGSQQGQLPAGREMWYALTYQDDDGDAYEARTISLVFTPEYSQGSQPVRFEIFPARQLQAWQRGDSYQSGQVGASHLTSRDGDSLTGERVWSGWLLDGETYLIRLRNDADVGIDYWLFTGAGDKPGWQDAPAR